MRRCIAALSVLAFALVGESASAQEFSADMTFTGGNASSTRPAAIYFSGGKLRVEVEKGGVVIFDDVAGTAHVLITERKVYLDLKVANSMKSMRQILTPLNGADPCREGQDMASTNRKDGATWTCRPIGREPVNGRRTIKYAGSYSGGHQSYTWVDEELKFPIKSADTTGSGVELKNIRVAPQPATLFQIPSDYKRLEIPQEKSK